MDSKTSVSVDFSGLLLVIFVTLKLVGERFHTPVADWSWWWVLCPLWIPFAIVAVILVGAGVVWLGCEIMDRRDKRRRRTMLGRRFQ